MMRRRQALAAFTASALGAPALALPKLTPFGPVAAPEPMAQIAAGGPTGLLGLSVDGSLFALTPSGGGARRIGVGLDAGTPLALGHGRIAARQRDGALWVLENGRSAVSVERTLAPAAGLLVLPLAIIAIAISAGRHLAVRLEPPGSGPWRAVAQSDVEVLPDARPLQADLDGSGDGGHVVVLAGPDRERYTHGVLGDDIEAAQLALLERHSLQVMRKLVLPGPHVFEDIAPRRVSLASRDALLSVQSGPLGAQLVLIDADPAAPALLRVAARGPAMGSANRWLSPITHGPHWLAVHTPHIGGVLHLYRQDGSRLVARKLQADVSNHRLGSRWLDMSAWQGSRLLLPDSSGRRLLLLDAASDWRIAAEHLLSSRVTATLSLGASGRVAVLHEDGSVTAGSISG